MKRLLCFLLVLSALAVFCSCEAIDDVLFNKYSTYTHSHDGYHSFEELLTNYNHIVVVKCIEKENNYSFEKDNWKKRIVYTFVVTEVVSGTLEEGFRFSLERSSAPSYVYLSGDGSPYSYDMSKISYKKGNRYVMPLYESGSETERFFGCFDNLFMPLTDLSKSTVYNEQPLIEHTANPDAFSSKEALIAYIQELTAKDALLLSAPTSG